MVKKEELLKALEKKTGCEWKIDTVKRADNTQYTGVMKLSERDENGTITAPVMPVELEEFDNVEALALAIIYAYDEMLEASRDTINAMKLSAGDIQKEWLKPVLINRARNRELLSETPHEDYLDLALIVKAFIPHDEGEECSCTITINDGVAKTMGLTMEEAFAIAKENALAMNAYYTKMNPPDDVDAEIPEDAVVPCAVRLGKDAYSSRVLYYPEIMKALMGDWDCYILPASADRLFLADKGIPIPLIRASLAQINLNTPDCDYLSYNVYELDKKTGKIRIVEE